MFCKYIVAEIKFTFLFADPLSKNVRKLLVKTRHHVTWPVHFGEQFAIFVFFPTPYICPVLHTQCFMSHVKCLILHVPCYLSNIHVTCHMIHFTSWIWHETKPKSFFTCFITHITLDFIFTCFYFCRNKKYF